MVILPKKAKNVRKKTRDAKPVKHSKKIESDYYKALNNLVKQLKVSTDEITNLSKNNASADDIANALEIGLQKSQRIFNENATNTAQTFTNQSSRYNKSKVEKSIANAFGVSTATIVDNESVSSALKLRTAQNTALIQSIPSKHWARVTQAVLDNYTGQSDKSLSESLKEIGSITSRHARFIARDQTAKLNGSLTRIRHQNIGINSYRWSNSKDILVVGNPSGSLRGGL